MGEADTNRRFWLGGKREPEQDRFFLEALDDSIWTAGGPDDWHACWYTGMPEKSVFAGLTAGQSINHIPGNSVLTVKSNLHATLAGAYRRMVAQQGDDSRAARRMAFFPRVYSMPEDYHVLQEAARLAPEKRWIVKPKNSARGKGISVIRDAATAPVDNASMVQEYIDTPHTMDGHKYVLRLYVLISSVEPLRVYLYNEGSVKLASEPYDASSIDNVYAHLTNPDINATNATSASPVVFRSFAHYREWLRAQGHDDAVLFARLRDMVALTAIAAREPMRQRLQETPGDTSGCYELLGLDCLVDAGLNPWILECNLSPSLEVCAAPADGGDVEEKMKRRLVADMVRLLDLNQRDHEEFASADPAERLRQQARAEHARAGDYTRIYPVAEADAYLPFFPLPRLADLVLADDAAGRSLERPRVTPWATEELIDEQRLGLYCHHTGTLYTPNETASWIWLQAADGTDPDAIADALIDTGHQAGQAPDPWQVRQQVWDVLADSAASGLLLQRGSEDDTMGDNSTRATAGVAPETPEASVMDIRAGTTVWRVDLPDMATRERLAGLFRQAPEDAWPTRTLVIRRTRRGYALADEHTVRADGERLARLAPALRSILLRDSVPDPVTWSVDGVVVPLASGTPSRRAALLVGNEATAAGKAAADLAQTLGMPCYGGAYVMPEAPERFHGAQLPVPLPCSGREPPIHEMRDRSPARLSPAGDNAGDDAVTVDTVIVVASGDDDAAGPSLQPIAGLDVLSALLPLIGTGTGETPDGADVARLLEWLGDCRLLKVRSDSPDAGAALATAIASGEPLDA